MDLELRHFHFCAGIGGAARGFDLGRPRVAGLSGRLRCIGGVDHDPRCVEAFDRFVDREDLGTVLDLFTLEQYVDHWGKAPPAGWREASAEDVRRAAGYENPHFVFMSPPCKGFSALVSGKKAEERKYQALNALPLRCWRLALEAWADDPPELLWMENVGRLWDRGREALDRIVALLEGAGYAVNFSQVGGDRRPGGVRCIGRWGRLGCRRPRFFMVARHLEKLPHPILEPPDRGYRTIGEVIGGLPFPGDPAAGPLHELPRLEWLTWLRLALVEPGKDHRHLRSLRVNAAGMLEDYRLVKLGAGAPIGSVTPKRRWYNGGPLAVRPWDREGYTITGAASPTCSPSSVADPRYSDNRYGAFGVNAWADQSRTVTSQSSPGQGWCSIADPRTGGHRFRNVLQVSDWDRAAKTLIGKGHPSSRGGAVADPRLPGGRYNNVYSVIPWDRPGATVTGGGTPSSGGVAVADIRPGFRCWTRGGHYGVLRMDATSPTITACGRHDNGFGSVADDRIGSGSSTSSEVEKINRGLFEPPDRRERGRFLIISPWGYYHRPLTKLDKLALMGFVEVGDEPPELPGSSTWQHEAIGNAVPVASATAIAEAAGVALLSYWSGQPLQLQIAPRWVRPHLLPFAEGLG